MSAKKNGFVLSTVGVLLGFALIVISACNNDGDNTVSETEVKANFVLMAEAVYSDSLTAAEALQVAVNVFLAAPSEATLDVAKAAYKSLRIPYQQSEIMRWDSSITVGTITGDEGIASVDDWEGQVNAWPLDESFIDYTASDAHAGIINDPSGFPVIDRALLVAQNGNGAEANVTTGIHAVEFLLWGQDNHGTGPGAGERPASDYDTVNCTVGHCDRRATYLQVATDLLVQDLTDMVAEWDTAAAETPGTLANNFLHSDAAVDYMLFAMQSMATDELASARMSAGLTLGDPEEEHDCFSDLSHVAIYYNFQGVRNAFYGRYGQIEGPSIGDLVKQSSPDTFNTMDAALQAIEVQMKQILDLGERETDPVRFDQIIGEGQTEPKGINYINAINASDALIALTSVFTTIRELLSLQELTASGSGDGD